MILKPGPFGDVAMTQGKGFGSVSPQGCPMSSRRVRRVWTSQTSGWDQEAPKAKNNPPGLPHHVVAWMGEAWPMGLLLRSRPTFGNSVICYRRSGTSKLADAPAIHGQPCGLREPGKLSGIADTLFGSRFMIILPLIILPYLLGMGFGRIMRGRIME